jgi:hypothetical protein
MGIHQDNIHGPRQGEVVRIATTNVSATTVDLSGSTFLGDLTDAGHGFVITSTVACYWKLALTTATAVSATASSTAGTAGGSGQGSYLPADTPFMFKFPVTRDGGTFSCISVQNTAATGAITVAKASSTAG